MRKHGPKSKQSLFWRFVPKRSASLGASGAVSAIITFCGLTCPTEKIVSDDQSNQSEAEPLWTVASTAFLSDIILPLKANGKQSNIGHGAHIGGSLFGSTVYVINRLWGAKIHNFVRKSAVFFKNLVPAKVVNIAGNIRRLFHRVALGLGRLWHKVYTGFCSLPLKEMFVFALIALDLLLDDAA